MTVREAYIDDSLMLDLERRARDAAGQGKEWMGLLTGTAFTWRGRKYIVIDGCASAKNEATAVSVRFNEEAFGSLAGDIAQCASQGKSVVGWVHTHPGYGCFLSATDLRTQASYFNEDYSVALVIDPTKTEDNRALKRFFKLTKDGTGYREASYASYRKA